MKRIAGTLCIALLAVFYTSCSGEAKSETADNEPTEEKAEVTTDTRTSATSSLGQRTDEDAIDWESYQAYNLTEVDTPPLFSRDCLTAKSPRSCSDEKLLQYISKNLVKPKGWNKKTLEQVLVIIEKDGTVKGVKYVASGSNEGCPECQKAAVDVVGQMTQWTAAIKDGKPVATKLSIP